MWKIIKLFSIKPENLNLKLIEKPSHWIKSSVKQEVFLKARIGWQSLKKDEFINNGKYFCVTGQDFLKNRIVWEKCYKVSENRYLQDKNIQLKYNDVLITKDGTIGKIAIVDKIPEGYLATLNSGIFVSRANFEQKYWYFLLKSKYFIDFINQQKSGSTILHLNQGAFEKLEILLPPIVEQKSIASILSKQESIINNLEKVIDNKEKILQEFSHRLLSGEIRLKDDNGTISMYKNPDDNWKIEKVNGKEVNVPKDWGKDKLINRDITNIKTGIKKYSGIMPYYATGDVGINQLFKPDGYYDYDFLPSRANLSLKNNSIYFARMQNTKKIINNINNSFKDFILSTGFLGLSINNDVFSQTFIYHIILNDNFNQLKDSLCFGGTQKSLNDNNAKKIEFIFPKISEQKLIADYLSKQEESIDNLKKLLEIEKKKFDFLLDNLLSGKYLVENTEEEDK